MPNVDTFKFTEMKQRIFEQLDFREAERVFQSPLKGGWGTCALHAGRAFKVASKLSKVSELKARATPVERLYNNDTRACTQPRMYARTHAPTHPHVHTCTHA